MCFWIDMIIIKAHKVNLSPDFTKIIYEHTPAALFVCNGIKSSLFVTMEAISRIFCNWNISVNVLLQLNWQIFYG